MDNNFLILMMVLGLSILLAAVFFVLLSRHARVRRFKEERSKRLRREALERRSLLESKSRRDAEERKPTVHTGRADSTLQPGRTAVPGARTVSNPVPFDPLNPLNPISPVSPFHAADPDPTPSRCDSSDYGSSSSSWSDSSSSSCDSSSASYSD